MSDELDLRHRDFELLGVKWSPVGLEITHDLSYDDAESIAVVLSRTVDAGKWGLADLIEFAERRWGEDRYSQIAAATGRSVGGLMNICSVARRVPRRVRRPSLTFSHHEVVARLDPDAQAHWLDVAEEYRFTVEELRAQVAPAGPNDAVRSEPKQPPVIEARTGSRDATPKLAQVAREILGTPRSLDGEACLGADVLERLRDALESE